MEEQDVMKRLKGHLPQFVNEVNPTELLPYLTCLSQATVEEIKARQDNKGKIQAAQELYSNIIRYKARGVKELLKALRSEKIGLEELANLIDPPSTKSNTATIDQKMVQKDTARPSVVDENTRKTYDGDTPLRRLPSSVYKVLRLLDSDDQFENWQSLAGYLDYTVEDISRFRQNHQTGSPMIAMYNDWMTREGSTLGHLMKILKKMGRVDISTELTKITGYQYHEENGEQTGRNDKPPEVLYQRLPDDGNPMENMGPIHPERQNKGKGIEEKDLPAPDQCTDNRVQNHRKAHLHEICDKEPINPVEKAEHTCLIPRQVKENQLESKESALQGQEWHTVVSKESTSKLNEKDTQDVVCSALMRNVQNAIIRELDECEHSREEQDLENPCSSSESEESNSRVEISSSNHTPQDDPLNNYKEFHKEKNHNKVVLTSEMKKGEESNINKVEKQDFKNDVGQQADQKVHESLEKQDFKNNVGQQADQKVYAENPSYEMASSPKTDFSSISEERNSNSDPKEMNERKKQTDETQKEVQTDSPYEAHHGFDSLGFVPMRMEEDHSVANQGSTFFHERDTSPHQGNSSLQQNEEAGENNNHVNRCIITSAGRNVNVNTIGYVILGLSIVIGVCFVVMKVKKSS